MRFPRREPGLVVSAVAHAALLAATLVVFSDARKFEDAQEYVPVEVVSDQQLNQVMKGDKTAKPAKPELRVDKVAQETETRPQPPLAEAKRDVSAPPPKLREPQAEDEAASPKAVSAPTDSAAKATPAPPPKPASKALPPEPEKREPDEAEVTRPKPPPRPTPERHAEDTPRPPTKQKAAPKREPPRLRIDEVAKLLEQEKRDENGEKPAKPKSSDDTTPKSKFSAARIADLLSREAPQRRASTGKEATHTASLGAPTADAPRMSPSLQAQIDGYMKEHYLKCWRAALSTDKPTYVPHVEFRLTRDGALEEPPRLINPSSDPVERSRGEQALAAVRSCSPMPVPPAFAPYYDYWRSTELLMEDIM